MCENVLGLIGISFVLFSFIKFVIFCQKLRYLYFTGPAINYADYGPWAVVTGCTSGIGKEFALQLAGKGLNIILVSRNLNKLHDLKEEIKEHFPLIQTKVAVVDFANNNETQYEELKEIVSKLKVGILINNAGTVTKLPYFIPNLKKERHSPIANCNIFGPVKMTEIILPSMVDVQTGLVVNISSTSAIKELGFIAIYGATKRFLSSLSYCLGEEYKHVTVQAVTPGFVVTNMTKEMSRNPTWYMVSSKSFVKSCLLAIGKQRSICGCFVHEVTAPMLKLTSSYVIAKSTKFMVKRRFKKLHRD